MMPSLADVFVPLLNHLLTQESWARQRLMPYSGQAATIEGGPVKLTMTVDESGGFRPSGAEEEATVTLSLIHISEPTRPY